MGFGFIIHSFVQKQKYTSHSVMKYGFLVLETADKDTEWLRNLRLMELQPQSMPTICVKSDTKAIILKHTIIFLIYI